MPAGMQGIPTGAGRGYQSSIFVQAQNTIVTNKCQVHPVVHRVIVENDPCGYVITGVLVYGKAVCTQADAHAGMTRRIILLALVGTQHIPLTIEDAAVLRTRCIALRQQGFGFYLHGKIIRDGRITAQSVIHVSAIVPAIQHDRTGGRCNRQYRTGKYRCCGCTHRNTIQCAAGGSTGVYNCLALSVPGIRTEIIISYQPRFIAHQSLPDKILYL